MNVKYICFCFQKWDFKQKTLPLTLTHALSQTYTIQNFLSVTYTLTKSLSLSPGPPTLSLSLSLSHNFQHKTLFSSQTHTQLCTIIGSLLVRFVWSVAILIFITRFYSEIRVVSTGLEYGS